jgi:hypothetical protein
VSWIKTQSFDLMNAQEAGIKDEILGWMFRDDPAVVGSLAPCKIDSSEWHDRSPLQY